MIVAGVRISHLILILLAALPFIGIYFNIKNESSQGSFRMTRVQTWLNPWEDITGERMANCTKSLCNRIWWIIWSRTWSK